jgi:hypothetical protein
MPAAYGITSREPLRFASGDPAGPFLSAASGVAWMGEDLVVVDDASAFAGVFPRGCPPGCGLRLFPPVGGHDRFSEAAGTKALKPDLEVLTPLPRGALLALGSGSRPNRMRGVLLSPGGRVEILDLAALYGGLAARVEGELNLEGAVAEGQGLLLFVRGNGRESRPAVVPLLDLAEAISGRPRFGEARSVALGELGGVTLGFTDACRLPDGRVLAALAAEGSPDAYSDGPVGGSALYDLERGEVVPLLEGPPAQRVPFSGKLEGICPDPRGAGRLLGVTDPDDPGRPGELLCLEAL